MSTRVILGDCREVLIAAQPWPAGKYRVARSVRAGWTVWGNEVEKFGKAPRCGL